MNKLTWTENCDQILKTYYTIGDLDSCIKLTNRTKGAIYTRANRLGLKFPKKFILTIDEVDEIIHEIKVYNLSLESFTTKYKINADLISRAIKDYYPNIDLINLRNSNNVNHNYFDEIGPNQAYFIGLIYSDGCIRYPREGNPRIIIGLQIGDKYILDKFSQELKMNRMPIIAKPSLKLDRKNRQHMAILNVSSIKLVEKLKDLGIGPRKSLTINVPIFFLENQDLFWHFIRGVFDGDGCISSVNKIGVKNKQFRFSIAGNRFTCTTLSKFIKEYFNLGSGKPYFKKGNTYTFNIGGNVQVKKIYSFLYKDAKFFLHRKYNKFLECFCQDNVDPPFTYEIPLESQILVPFENALTPNFPPS